MDPHDRLFLMTDPATHKVVSMCTGPDADGRCPRASEPPYDCVGLRVVPAAGSGADGLPFTVTASADGRCPLAWLDERPPGDGDVDSVTSESAP
jgi:hypothetical protein